MIRDSVHSLRRVVAKQLFTIQKYTCTVHFRVVTAFKGAIRQSINMGVPEGKFNGANKTQKNFFLKNSNVGIKKTQNFMLISNSLMPAFRNAPNKS
jgi:hypothetical protein